MSLRLKIFLASFLTCLAVGFGTSYMFSTSWVDLARSYGLMSLNRRLADLRSADELEPGEWAFSLDVGMGRSRTAAATWIRPPVSVPEAKQQQFAAEIFDNVRKTNLRSGSFETPLKLNGAEVLYFIAFHTKEDLQKNRILFVAGTQAQLDLQQLSPWTAPFLSVLVGALFVGALAAFGIAGALNRSYLLLERSIENIGAGRLEGLKLPKGGDSSLRNIIRALQDMVRMLEAKEKRIAEVSNLAYEDPMTRIPNFRAFQAFVEKILKGTYTADSSVALIIIDLDFFKKVNDTYGHQVGDFVLQQAAQIIKDNIREKNVEKERDGDFYGRYGGEEFVVVFSKVGPTTDFVGAQRILRAIRKARLEVPATITSDKKPLVLEISASMGLSLWDKARHQTKDGWIKEADEALYLAKKSGRGRLIKIHPQKAEWLP
jgi:diguanylate cyclase (GGDEF)-like protein